MAFQISKAVVAALVLAMSSAASAPVYAQVSAVQATPSARSVELVRRMLTLAGLDRQFNAMWEGMIPIYENNAAIQKLSPEQRSVLIGTVREVMTEEFMPKLTEKMVNVYATSFTEQELEAIVAFYETPAGRAALERTPALVQRSMGFARELMPEAQTEVMRRICEKIDCKTGAPKARPS